VEKHQQQHRQEDVSFHYQIVSGFRFLVLSANLRNKSIAPALKNVIICQNTRKNTLFAKKKL
jgi:hypothetical protein